MKLEDLGFNEILKQDALNYRNFKPGRVVAEHKERYVVSTEDGEFDAEITGNLRFTATSRLDFPAVGDWVALIEYDSQTMIIQAVIPRFSIITRKAKGKFGELQIIAANVDYALLVQAVDRDFNVNRLERYLTICYESKVLPLIVLTKVDLIDKQTLATLKNTLHQRIKDIPVVAVTNTSLSGYDSLEKMLVVGKTYCMLGSSGVGKSTLLNSLCAKSVMRTDTISQSTHKGRHVTSHRELTVLANGAILIDNPGMREVGNADSATGLAVTFDTVLLFSHNCKYSDCTHKSEIGCAVIDAVEKGLIDKTSYDNYLKLEREKEHFESSLSERRLKEKEFGKITKNYKKSHNSKTDK